MQAEVRQHFRHNFVVNLLDGSFYGFALGFSSTVTVLPLFVSTLTDSTTLIGLIASVQLIGWQLPQLLTARRAARQTRYKPLTLRLTVQERLPFLGLALLALLVPAIPKGLVLALTFVLFGWHAIGSGLTAPPYQSMIGKIIPAARRGTFYGVQSAGFSLLSGIGAALAGIILRVVPYPANFAACFFIAGLLTIISWIFLASTREPESLPPESGQPAAALWRDMLAIWRRDPTFRRFTLARVAAQFALVGMNFYTIYAVRRFNLPPDVIGVMTSVLLFAQMAANPAIGWLGDRLGHAALFAAGALALGAGNLVALAAGAPEWLYAAFALAGIGSAAVTTAALALALAFGHERERPYYIGLGNTLTAPFALAAPLLAGWLADSAGYDATFGLTLAAAVVTTVMLLRGASRYARRPSPADL